MRKLPLTLSVIACAGLAAPAYATDRILGWQSNTQLERTETGKAIDQYSGTKKDAKKKKAVTKRSSWGTPQQMTKRKSWGG